MAWMLSYVQEGVAVSQMTTYWFVSWWFDNQKAQKSKV